MQKYTYKGTCKDDIRKCTHALAINTTPLTSVPSSSLGNRSESGAGWLLGKASARPLTSPNAVGELNASAPATPSNRINLPKARIDVGFFFCLHTNTGMADDEDLEIELSDIEDETQDNRARHREGNLNVPNSETFAGSGITQAEVEQAETQNAPPASFHASKVVDALSKLSEKQMAQLQNLTRLPVEQLNRLPISDSQKVNCMLTCPH